MKTNITGLNNGYKKILEKITSIQQEEMYHLGYGIGDLPYHLQGEELQNEKIIYNDIAAKINELEELLKQSITE